MHLELLIFPHWAYRSAPPCAVQNHTSHRFLHTYVHTHSCLCLQVHIHIQVHTHVFVHVYAGMGTGVCSCVCMQGWRPRTKFSSPAPGAIHLCFSSFLLDYALLVARLSGQGALGIHLSALPTALGLHECIAIPSFHIIIISACMCGRRMCTACV